MRASITLPRLVLHILCSTGLPTYTTHYRIEITVSKAAADHLTTCDLYRAIARLARIIEQLTNENDELKKRVEPKAQ